MSNDNVTEPSLSHQAYHTSIFNVFIPFEIENHVDILLFDWNKVNLHRENVFKLSLSLQAFLCTLTFIFVPNDNVSEPSLSRQAYRISAFNLFRNFEIENQVDLLRFDRNNVNLHCENVFKLSLSLQAFLCTSTFIFVPNDNVSEP